MSESKELIVPITEETLERMISRCTEAQQEVVDKLFSLGLETGDFDVYQHVTGMDPEDSIITGVNETIATPQPTEQGLSKGTAGYRGFIPASKGLSDNERADLYEKRAADFAFDVMMTELLPAGTVEQEDFTQWVALLRDEFKRDSSQLGILKNDPKALKILGEKHADMLESLYNKMVDAFVDGLSGMKEDEATPFHIDLVFDEDPITGELNPRAVDTKVVYLDDKNNNYDPLYISVPATDSKVLDKETMDEVSKQAVYAVTNYLVERHMKRSGEDNTRHSKYHLCFLEGKEKQKGKIPITEQGAELLEDTITSIAGKLAAETVRQRATVNEHMSGFRWKVSYQIAADDSMEKHDVTPFYFRQERDTVPFGVADFTEALGELDEDERENFMWNNYQGVIKDILVNVFARNMQNTNHPAFSGYFKVDDKRAELTEAGERAFGQDIEDHTNSLADALMCGKRKAEGGKYYITYGLNQSGISEIGVTQFEGLALMDKGVQQLYESLVQSPVNSADREIRE